MGAERGSQFASDVGQRGQGQRVAFQGQCSFFYGQSVAKQLVAIVVFVKRREAVVVDETDLLLAVEHETNGLIDMLHLVVLRVGRAVGRHDAVY